MIDNDQVWFRHGGAGDWDDLKEELDKFLQEYEPGYWANAGASQTKCTWDRPPLKKEEACEFNKEWLSDQVGAFILGLDHNSGVFNVPFSFRFQGSDIKCITEEHYGYYHGKPCLLLKLNRIYGWEPIPYRNLAEVNESGMPEDLKNHIQQVGKINQTSQGWMRKAVKITDCFRYGMKTARAEDLRGRRIVQVEKHLFQ